MFGANVAIPQLKNLSAAINKCSTAAQKFLPNLCDMVKVMLKSNTDSFKAAANALTDVQFFFSDVLNFYNSVLNCLNEQTEATTPEISARVLGNLIFQIEGYILNGVSKLSDSAKPLGVIFGERVEKVIKTIADQFTEEFTVVKTSLETLTTDLLAIDVTVEITAETLQQDLNATAISDMTTSFKDISVSSEQMATIIKDVSTIIKTLSVTVNSAEKVESVSVESVTKANYQLDVTVQASKNLLEKNVDELGNAMTMSFSEFSNLTATLFVGDKEIQESRDKVETFLITIRATFVSVSDKLVTSFSEFYKMVNLKTSETKEAIASMTTKVQEYLGESIASNSGSFIKCLGPSTNLSVQALLLIKEMGTNASTCIKTQQTTTLSAQSLMRFVIEDVVLNTKGAADKLCGCSVKGGKKDTEKSKKCMTKVRSLEFP